jgi:AcrR family transcriptional regulator
MARRTAAEAELTRRGLLESARALFAQLGFAGTSLNAVAQRAGVTRGAINHHFGGKIDLFTAVFVELEEELDNTVRAAAAGKSTTREAFMAACAAWLDFAVRSDYRQIAVTDAPAVLGAATWHRIDAGIGLATMELGLKALHSEQPLAIDPSRELAVLLFGALTEAGITLAHGDVSGRDRLLRTLDELITTLHGSSPATPAAATRRRRRPPSRRDTSQR